MSDRLLNDCLVTFIKRDIFSLVSDDDIIHAFMAMRKRKVASYIYVRPYLICNLFMQVLDLFM